MPDKAYLQNLQEGNLPNETENVKARYDRRKTLSSTYGLINMNRCMAHSEKLSVLVRWMRYAGLEPLAEKKLLEIGCGSGSNLLQFLQFGFSPQNMVGVELLEDRAECAKKIFPNSLEILCGDASTLDLGAERFDILVQSTVFSSLMDDDFQQKLAMQMWKHVKPGGGILWYDFIYNNPRNADVRGVPVKRIIELFPEAEVKVWRVTLAPPLGKLAAQIHPFFYSLFNLFPFLRTHVLCWIKKMDRRA